MSSNPPWRDALRRATGATAPTSRSVPAPSLDASMGSGPVARGASPSITPSAISPMLAALMAERERLQASVAALTRSDTGDPRYTVAPMAERRAEFTRWSAVRDNHRPEPVPRLSPDPTKPILHPTQGAMAPALRATPGSIVPDLRATPGESIPSGSVPTDPRQWMVARAASIARVGSARDAIGAMRDVGRALRDVGAANRNVPMPGQPQPSTRSAAEQLRTAGQAEGDPLERRLARARDLVSRSRKAGAAAQHALEKARSAIADDWVERASERIPGLGRADPYIRETARKLLVAVGTVDQLTSKADVMRELAQSVRELQAADAANDDSRRDRALARLKARRAERDG